MAELLIEGMGWFFGVLAALLMAYYSLASLGIILFPGA